MSNPWLRLYAEFSHDPKVQMMSEALQRRYIMLMCLRCSNSPLDDELVAFHLRISLEVAIRTRELLVLQGLITDSWDLVRPIEIGSDRPMAHVWKAIRNRIFKRDNYTCQYCGDRGNKLECDHVIPVSKGGLHDDGNLVTACFSCNRSKRDKLVSEWRPA